MSVINKIYTTSNIYNPCIGCFTRQFAIKAAFFGTDEFSLSSLRLLHRTMKHESLIKRLDIVTNISTKRNPVLTFARQNSLNIRPWPVEPFQPEEFDIGLVVSFGHMIPEKIINSFKNGMINVHASLLPRWRGAAPIIYSIKNGDNTTGVSIMKIKPKHFDVGEVIAQTEIQIDKHILMPELRSVLSEKGAQLLLECVKDMPTCLYKAIPQNEELVTYAPRVTSSIAVVDWSSMSAKDVYNLYRAVYSLYPLSTNWNGAPIKLFDCSLNDIIREKKIQLAVISQKKLGQNIVNLRNMSKISQSNYSIQIENSTQKPGFVFYDKKRKLLRILCADGQYVSVNSVGVANKRMTALDFNNGFLKKKCVHQHYFL